MSAAFWCPIRLPSAEPSGPRCIPCVAATDFCEFPNDRFPRVGPSGASISMFVGLPRSMPSDARPSPTGRSERAAVAHQQRGFAFAPGMPGVSLRRRPPVAFSGDWGDFALCGGRVVSAHEG